MVSECLTVDHEVSVLSLLLGFSITGEYGAVEVDWEGSDDTIYFGSRIGVYGGCWIRACVGSRVRA